MGGSIFRVEKSFPGKSNRMAVRIIWLILEAAALAVSAATLAGLRASAASDAAALDFFARAFL